MGRRLRRRLETWLEAEAAGRLAEAEEALFQAFRELPPPLPPSGLVRSVLDALGMGAEPALLGRGSKLVVAASFLLVASGLLLFPLGSTVVASLVAPGTLLVGVARTAAGFLGWVLDGLALWQFFASLGHAAAVVVATPEGALLLLSMVTVGVAALRLLYTLTPRENVYVH